MHEQMHVSMGKTAGDTRGLSQPRGNARVGPPVPAHKLGNIHAELQLIADSIRLGLRSLAHQMVPQICGTQHPPLLERPLRDRGAELSVGWCRMPARAGMCLSVSQREYA